jgi:Holliday junction resolvase
MTFVKRKGYIVERKIRIFFEKAGWKVVRAGASLGEADLICVRKGKCVMLQIKSTKKKAFYYYGWIDKKFEGFPFYLVVDFGYGKIRILEPQKKVTASDGVGINEFLYDTGHLYNVGE